MMDAWPGPWELKRDGLIYGPPAPGSSEATFIADIRRTGVNEWEECTEQDKANGRLLAAARELFDMVVSLQMDLIAAEAALEGQGDLVDFADVLDEADKLIAKVGGRQTP
jgi:hypothetical protein